MLKPSVFGNIKKFALVYATGGITALQALRWEIFSFPPLVKLYLGWFFSIETILCIFLAGPIAIEYIKKANEILKKMNESDATKSTDEKLK